MANVGWASVPIIDQEGQPSSTYMLDNALDVGSGVDYVRYWAMGKYGLSFMKVCYFGSEYDCYSVYAVNKNDIGLGGYYMRYSKKDDYYTVEAFGGVAEYGNIIYFYSSWTNASAPYLNPDIPLYETLNEALAAMDDGIWEDVGNDPYRPGGETEQGGGDGNFDNTSEPIDFPPIPILSAVDTGFLTLFNPSLAQLKELSSYMWSDLFDINGWKKIFANPMDAIIGLTIVPVAVPSAGIGTVSVGNIPTGISMTKAAGQYVELDCGTLNVNEYWGAYLDYEPYTKAEIYLPFIGIHSLSTDDIMKKTIHIKYHIDLLSGACCAYVKCGDSILYSFVGQCSSSIPITSTDWTNIINGVISIAGAIGSMAATNGATAPMSVGTIASAAVNSLKPSIEKSGPMSSTGGILGVQYPYLILTRPRQALPNRLNTYTGYPTARTMSLGEVSGFTVIDAIHLENIPATESELDEIESLLKEGVIF